MQFAFFDVSWSFACTIYDCLATDHKLILDVHHAGKKLQISEARHLDMLPAFDIFIQGSDFAEVGLYIAFCPEYSAVLFTLPDKIHIPQYSHLWRSEKRGYGYAISGNVEFRDSLIASHTGFGLDASLPAIAWPESLLYSKAHLSGQIKDLYQFNFLNSSHLELVAAALARWPDDVSWDDSCLYVRRSALASIRSQMPHYWVVGA